MWIVIQLGLAVRFSSFCFFSSVWNHKGHWLITSVFPWNYFVHSPWKPSWEIDVKMRISIHQQIFFLSEPRSQISEFAEKSILPVTGLAWVFHSSHISSNFLSVKQAFFLPRWQNRCYGDLWEIGSVNQETLICFKQRSSFEFF